MTPTIEIKPPMSDIEGDYCSPRCGVNRSECPYAIRRDSPNKFTYYLQPGPDCPGPGRYRLIDEAKIEELCKIIGTWTTPVDIAVPVRILNNWITAAGLGRKEKRNED
jgi:hypothetical protein